MLKKNSNETNKNNTEDISRIFDILIELKNTQQRLENKIDYQSAIINKLISKKPSKKRPPTTLNLDLEFREIKKLKVNNSTKKSNINPNETQETTETLFNSQILSQDSIIKSDFECDEKDSETQDINHEIIDLTLDESSPLDLIGNVNGNMNIYNFFSQISNPQKKTKPHVKRVKVIRGKKKRKLLKGRSCKKCETFFKALGDDLCDEKMMKKCSRHRHEENNTPTDYTPKGYWFVFFLD